MTRYAWSTSAGGSYNSDFDSREAALAAGRAETAGSKIFTGVVIPFTTKQFMQIDVDDILDSIACQVEDEAGEHSDGWPDVSREAREELEAMLQPVLGAWAAKHVAEPTFYGVDEIEEHAGQEEE